MKASIVRYLRTAAIAVTLFAISPFSDAGDSTNSFYSSDVRLNPECKIKRMSNGEVIVTAKTLDGDQTTHKFSDFYADLLMAAYRKQSMDYIVTTFSKKYYLSQDDCRREIKHAVNTLLEWNIFVRKNQIALQ